MLCGSVSFPDPRGSGLIEAAPAGPAGGGLAACRSRTRAGPASLKLECLGGA